MIKDKTVIANWLKKHQINNYKLVESAEWGYVVDVAGNVSIAASYLTAIPVKFGSVEGDFICCGNELTSLRGSPDTVGGIFDCNDNNLTSLEYCPKVVREGFQCENNQLENLDNLPQEVGKMNSFSMNFYAHTNSFSCMGNPSLGELQNLTDLDELRAAYEKRVLAGNIEVAGVARVNKI